MSENRCAYVFPGQGSQKVGMGRDLFDYFKSSRAVFEQADEILRFPLSKLCFEGPEEELRHTVNAQPALLAMSIATLEAARESGAGKIPLPAFVAGHSLGEYTALVAAGVLNFANAVLLAKERGRLMHEASKLNPGTMAAVIGLDESAVSEICRDSGTWLANINCPSQIVISGSIEKVGKSVSLAEAKKVRAIALQVSGAFHTPLMEPACQGLSKIIGNMNFKDPSIPIIANSSAQPLTKSEQIKSELLAQLCNPVQWQRSVEYMIGSGVTTFIEIGAGKVLSGLIKRINREVKTLNIGDINEVKTICD